MVKETKLLGLVIRSDLSWCSNTDYMTKRCNSKLWILRRLLRLGAMKEDLLDIYTKQASRILEYAVAVCHSSIIGEQRLQIERIQKTAFHIILGEESAKHSKFSKRSKSMKRKGS